MANSPQARKRARQNTKRRLHNRTMRSMMRTTIKTFLKSVAANDRQTAEAAYRSTVSVVDRMAGKGLEHKNRAARLKRRLNNRLRGMAQQA